MCLVKELPDSQSVVGGFARAVCQCHAQTHISPVATWDQGTGLVDESWILQHMFENLAGCSDGGDEGDSWMLDISNDWF